VLDLLRTADGPRAGITLHVLGEGTQDGVGSVLARAVVLATGGMGQVFASTTNPSVSTGDGVALALRAGAAVADLEFVQFHPTALYLGPGATGQQPLISEAVRGEGAFLVDAEGRRVISTDDHPLADLAPRDVVAKAIHRRILEQGVDHVFLDARGLGEQLLLQRFPTIVERCREAGVDPVTEPVPVVPAAHYASGGVRTDLHGRTDVPGSLRLRRGRLHGRARRQPAGQQQPARGPGVRRPHRRRPRASLPPQGEPVAGRDEGVLVDASVRPELGPHDERGAPASCAARARWRDRRAARRAGAVPVEGAGPGGVGGDRPAPGRHGAGGRRGAARGDPRLALARRPPGGLRRVAGHLVTTLTGTAFEPLEQR
jgi:hypothetical protein